jgi:hypothetical protein
MKWQELDAKAKRKAIILAAIVGFALLALMWPTGAFRSKPKPRPSPFGGAARREAGAPPLRPPAQAPKPSPDAVMLGKWTSAPVAIPKRGLCTLWLEVTRKAEEPGKYTGAASLSCLPTVTPDASKVNPALMFVKINPMSATMTGAFEKEAIVFRLEKVLNAGDCGLTGFSVSKFGSQNIAAEFQDECGGGSMVMRKAG